MSKRRKTRQEKIIAQLRRQLAQRKTETTSLNTKPQVSQEAISYRSKGTFEAKLDLEKPNTTIFFYDPRLVKKDIIKTVILSLAIISFQLVLYLKLR